MKNIKNAIDHLKNHQQFPATKEELVAECDNLSDFSEKDKKWFEKHLADKTYESADDVIGTLGLAGQAAVKM